MSLILFKPLPLEYDLNIGKIEEITLFDVDLLLDKSVEFTGEQPGEYTLALVPTNQGIRAFVARGCMRNTVKNRNYPNDLRYFESIFSGKRSN